MAFRYRLPMPFDAEAYVADVPRYSDFRKFDDGLKMNGLSSCSGSR